MTEDNSNANDENEVSNLVDIDDLDTFEDKFYDKAPKVAIEEEVEDEEIDENEDDTLETEEDQDAEEVDEPTEDAAPEEEEPEPAPKPKGKKSFQNRIDELTADKYEDRRTIEALRKELEQLKVRPEEKQEAPKLELPANAPQPDAVNDKGEPLYPLGEFDPKFITALTKFTYSQEAKVAKEEAAREAAAAAKEKEVRALSVSWNEKLEKAEEALPDIREEIKGMVDLFQGIEADYGEYLATTIMSSELGAEVMHYLSQNIGEAQKIVASGPAAATLALGRLEGKLLRATEEEEKRNTKKVSEAPPAPDSRVRGRGGQFVVRDDTDDLEAFERKFFK